MGLTRAEQAAGRLERAKQSLAAARLRMAETTCSGEEGAVPSPRWRWAHDLAETRGREWSRIDNVMGWGLGHRVREGVRRDQPCVTVFVSRKYRNETLEKRGIRKVPGYVRTGDTPRLPVDVIQLGRLDLQVGGSASVGPNDKRLEGTLGCFAVDFEGSVVTGITAMHVTGRLTFPSSGGGSVGIVSPSLIDANAPPTIGTLVRGSRRGIDAAKIRFPRLSDPLNAIPSIGLVRGWRKTTFPGDVDAPVRMSGSNSGFQHGQVVHPSTSLPGFDLENAILVRMHSVEGDSGSALFDNNNLVLGFLVGTAQASGLRVFTPADLVLSRLLCDIRG